MWSLLQRARLDLWAPAPEGADASTRLWILRHGGPGPRIRALRACVAAEDVDAAGPPALSTGALLGLLSDPVPGMRRTAAWALGWRGEVSGLHAVWHAARRERCDTTRLAMAVAATRLGAEPSRAWALLDHAARRRLATYYGARSLAEAAGAGPDVMARRWFRALDPEADHQADPASVRPVDPRSLRQRLIARLEQDPEDRFRLLDLAALQHPADHERVAARKWVSGRRESHVVCEALGENGDPRAIGLLSQVLRAMDVDPGHGFAGRRAASIALGRIGDPTVGGLLAKALVDEAHDHEGRPGAGLGIQFPVRAVMLAALGEAGCVEHAALLTGYLSDASGSALGGFYLPAMDALWKLDPPSVLEGALTGPALPAANALGVLAGLGRLAVVKAHLRDHRPEVARAARLALDLAQGGEKAPAGS